MTIRLHRNNLKRQTGKMAATDIEITQKSERHCAFCLKLLPSGNAKFCGGCKRRAYCSRECQVSDWQIGKGGQGHKNWCKFDCGEENIDWEVRPVPGKGLGVIAKRLIPAKYRIIVDGLRNRDHPGINDLMPHDGTVNEKLEMNQLEFGENKPAMCLRIARVNHDCNPNSGHHDDDVHTVKLLISERDIQPGEEITISYTHIHAIYRSDLATHLTGFLDPSITLKLKWGITCPYDCFCKNKTALQRIKECQKLLYEMENQMKIRKADRAMEIVRQLIGTDIMTSIWHVEAGILLDAFRIGIMRRSTLDEALPYIRRAYEILSSVFHPNCTMVKQVKKYLDDPSCHNEYLMFG